MNSQHYSFRERFNLISTWHALILDFVKRVLEEKVMFLHVEEKITSFLHVLVILPQA